METIVQVKLKPLNKNNWEACANLKVSDEQRDSLPDNMYSIAELNFYPQSRAVAITNNEEQIIGFATFGIPDGENVSKIFRLMIDESQQGKGYGKAALIQIVKRLLKENNDCEIQVCYNPEKPDLKKFYSSVGFKEQGVIPSKRSEKGKMLATLKPDDFKIQQYGITEK